MNSDQQVDYRQQIGLKKILYKYQNQNQQLRSQIRALNQRLSAILSKPNPPLHPPTNPILQYQGRIMKKQMNRLYSSINKQTQQMKINKDGVDERHEQKCKEIQNKIVKENKQIKQLMFKLKKYDEIDEGMKLGNLFLLQKTGNNNNDIGSENNNNSYNYKVGDDSNNSKNIQPQMLKNLTLRSSTIRIQNYFQKLSSILQQTQKSRKSIKQLQRIRDSNQRRLLKKHTIQVDVKIQNRQIQYGKSEQQNMIVNQQSLLQIGSPRKKGIWGMENTKENYQFIKKQIEILKGEKENALKMIKNQNIVLENKIKQLELELEQMNKSVEMPPLPYQKRVVKIDLPESPLLSSMRKSINARIQQQQQQQQKKPSSSLHIQFQHTPSNDKNYIPKKSRFFHWQSSKYKSGIQWSDFNIKSFIIGVNLWFDQFLIGIQFIHSYNNISVQHIQIMNGKKIMPIQYRLMNQDYVENVVLYISGDLIVAVEFVSNKGKIDTFGNKNKGKKFDFGIRKPQKPIASYGQYRINNNLSEITKLGFEIL